MSREPLTRRERTGIAATACVALLTVGGAFWYGEYYRAAPPHIDVATDTVTTKVVPAPEATPDSAAADKPRQRKAKKPKSIPDKSRPISSPRRHLQDYVPSE